MSERVPTEFEQQQIRHACWCGAGPGEWCRTRRGSKTAFLHSSRAKARAVRGPHPHKISEDGPAYDPGPGLAELARAESLPSEIDMIAMAMWAQSPNEPIADLEELPEVLRAEFRRRAVALRAQLLRMGWISPTGS